MYMHYEDEPVRPAPRGIWRQLRHDMAIVTWVCVTIAAGVWLSDFLW